MTKRNINYYELKVVGTDRDALTIYRQALDELNTRNTNGSSNRFRPMSGGGIMIIRQDGGTNNSDYFVSTSIKNTFPGIYDLTNDEIQQLEAEEDSDKGIPEEAHFVVFWNERLNHPIVAVESTMKAPRGGDIEKYFTKMVTTEENQEIEFVFEPVFAFDLGTLEERLIDVASIRIIAHQSQINEISNFDENLATGLRTLYDYAGGEYIEINSWTNFGRTKSRPDTESLVRRAFNLIGLFREDPERKRFLTKVDIKAQDRDNSGKLRTFDLIQSRVASEVTAERRRPRSQYYESIGLYNSINDKIREDFRC